MDNQDIPQEPRLQQRTSNSYSWYETVQMIDQLKNVYEPVDYTINQVNTNVDSNSNT